MISYLKDDNDKIYAFVEFNVVDLFGQLNDFGDYIWVAELWIHPDYRQNGSLNKLVYLIDSHPQSKNAKWVYWNNGKHDRKTRCFPRERLAKKGVYTDGLKIIPPSPSP